MILSMILSAKRMRLVNDHRGEPVTLEEMTRRRDRRRARWDETDRKWRAAVARELAAARRVSVLEHMLLELKREVVRQTGRANSAQAEARHYATECGRLRDDLAEAQEAVGLVCDACSARIAEHLYEKAARRGS
jgi:hypothetical protein